MRQISNSLSIRQMTPSTIDTKEFRVKQEQKPMLTNISITNKNVQTIITYYFRLVCVCVSFFRNNYKQMQI